MQPPSPEEDISKYTKERLEEGLSYVTCRLNATRKITPRTEKALRLYEDSILQAITAKDEETKKDCIKEIKGMEKLISTNAVFRGGLSEQAEALQIELLRFRELEYNARYGDYFALPFSQLRYHSGKHKTSGHENLSGKHIWSEIATSIRREQRALDGWSRLTRAQRKSIPEPPSPYTSAVYAGCHYLGFDPNRMLWAIERYAERNNTMHADIAEMIKEGQWMELGSVVYRDLQELHCLVPEGCDEDMEHLTAILEGLLDKYLDRTHGHRDRPWTWNPSAYAKMEHVRRSMKAISKDDQDKLINERRTFDAQQVEAKRQRYLQAVKGSALNTNHKRNASTETPRGSEKEMTVDQKRQRKRGILARRLALDKELERLKNVDV